MLISPTSFPPQCRRHGFTLIQAFAAVAASVVLFAVVSPIFRQAREGTRSSCQSNLKLIGLALMQYTQDTGDYYPRTTNGYTNGSSYKVVSWRRVLGPYTHDSVRLWQCTGPASANPNCDVLSPLDALPICYDVTDSGPLRPGRSVNVAEVAAPATTFLVFEKNGDSLQAQLVGVPWDHDSGEPGWTNILYGGHFGASNYLFADGHVKSYYPLQTSAGKYNPVLPDSAKWNPWHLNNADPISPRAMAKLMAAQRNFPK